MLRSSHDACGCSTQTTSTINLKRSTLHPHEGQADRPNTPSDSVNLGSNPGPPTRESASNRCVFVVSSLAGIVLKLPRVSYPANASAATRDAKCLGAGRERLQGLSRPFSSRRMWSVSAGFLWRVRGQTRGKGAD